MAVDTNFNFFGLITKCCELLDLDVPTTWEDTEETEYKKLKNVLNAINRSIILSEFERWSFRDIETTITLQEGVVEYDRPDGLIKTILNDNGIPLIPEYAWDYLPTDVTGTPKKYYVYAENILLHPRPTTEDIGKVFTVKYFTNECACTRNSTTGKIETYKANLDSEGDYSLIPTQFSDALIYGACRDYKALPDRAKYQHYNARYTQEIRQMRKAMIRSLEIEPYVDTGGGRSNQDIGWIDYFFKEAWK
jgi:hypothetical protein